jgi:hypothetical protein
LVAAGLRAEQRRVRAVERHQGLIVALTPAGRDLVRRATEVARDVDARFFGADAAVMRAALRRRAEPRGTPASPR